MKLRLTQQPIICLRLSRIPQGDHKKNLSDSKRGVALERKSYIMKKIINYYRSLRHLILHWRGRGCWLVFVNGFEFLILQR